MTERAKKRQRKGQDESLEMPQGLEPEGIPDDIIKAKILEVQS